MSRFYKAGPRVASLCEAIFASRLMAHQAAKEIAKEIGAVRTEFFVDTTFGDMRITGFKFKTEPDKKLFRQKPTQPECWMPRRNSKAGREIIKRLESSRSTGMDGLVKAIGMKPFAFRNGGICMDFPGISKVGESFYLELPDNVVPADCLRISDVEFEQLKAKDSKSRKTRKKKSKAA